MPSIVTSRTSWLPTALAVMLFNGPTASAQNTQEPFGAEDGAAEEIVPHIPEPMVFDLVRPLGALQGEFEANVLGLFPLSDLEEREIEWAPEVEFALFDGFALEFELPFEGNRLDAYKFAGQLTFGTHFDERFIHGTQFIGERFKSDSIWQLSPLYIAGFRFDDRWSTLVMVGYRATFGGDVSDTNELLVNHSLFLDLTPRASLGFETNFDHDFEGEWHLLLIPQLHYEIFDHIMIQAGMGLQIDSGDANGTAAARLIFGW